MLNYKKTVKTGPCSYDIEDSTGTVKKVPCDFIGQLNAEKFNDLKTYWDNKTDKKLDYSKTIIINYIDKDPNGVSINYPRANWNIFYDDLEEDLNKIAPNNHLWVIDPNVKNLYFYYNDTLDWVTDTENLVGDLFFHHGNLNGGYLIIKPDGNYYRKVGEYTKENMLKTFTVY